MRKREMAERIAELEEALEAMQGRIAELLGTDDEEDDGEGGGRRGGLDKTTTVPGRPARPATDGGTRIKAT